MATKELTNLAVKVSMDSTGFQAGVGAINKNLAVVKSEFKAASAEMGGFGNSTDQLKLKSSSLNQQIDLQKQKVDALQKAFKDSADKKGLDAKATQDLQIKLNGARTELAGMETALGKTNTQLDASVKKEEALTQANGKLKISSEQVKTAMGAVGVAVGAYLGSAVKSAVAAQESVDRLNNLLKNQGMSAEEAGAGIKSFTSAITKMSAFSGGEAREALQTLTEKGISLGKALEMEGTLADVAAGRNISLKEAADLVADAYNGKTRALTLLGILTKEEAKNLGDTEDATISMADVQQRLNDRFGGAAQAQLGTYSGKMKQMENQMNAAKTTIGTALLPILAELAKVLASILTPIATLIQQHPQFAAVLASLVAIFGTLYGGMSLFRTVGTVLTPLGPMLGALSTAFGVTTAAEAGAATGATVFGVSLSTAILPILAVVAAVALLAFGVYEVIKHWDGIKEFFSKLWTSIKDIFSKGVKAVGDFLKNWGPTLLTVLAGPLGLMVSFVAKHWTEIKQGAVTAWNGIKTSLTTAWNSLKETSGATWDGIKNGVVGAFEWMYNHNYYFKNLVDSINSSWDTVKTYTSQTWDTVKEFSAAKWGEIKETLSTLWDGLKTKAGETWDGISTKISTIWGSIQSTTGPLWDGIKNTLLTTWGTITTAADTVLSPIETTLSGLWGRISNAVSNAWGSIGQALSEAWGNIKQGFADLANEAWDWGSNLLNNFIDGIRSKISDLIDIVRNAAQTVASYLGFHSPAEEGPGADADKWAPNLMKMFSQGLNASIPELRANLGMVVFNMQPALAGASASNAQASVSQGPAIDYKKLGQAVADALSGADIRTNLTLGSRELTALNRSLQPVRANESKRRGGQA